MQQISDLGLTSLDGSISSTVDATGATPASIPTGAVDFNVPIPNPIPSSGVTIDVPTPPPRSGPSRPRAATSPCRAGTETDVTFNVGNGIGILDLHCSSYPNNILPSGLTDNTTFPPGLPIAPVIATAGR